MRTFDGLDLHVRTHGPEDAPVTVALAHCWTADTEDWHYQVDELQREFGHEVRVLTWDHRGHGRSDRAPLHSCTIHHLARDMGDVIDAHASPGRLVLAGHSIGGMAMMALAEERPDLLERVDGALFVSTSSGRLDTVTLGLPEVHPLARAAIPRILGARAALLSRRQRWEQPRIERMVVRRFLFGEPKRLRDQGLVVDQVIRCPPETMEGFFRDFSDHERTDATKAYDGIPTRVLVGDRDLLTPVPHARRLASAIRGARLLIAPGAGHMLTLERHELVSAELVDLVRGALAGARARPGSTSGARVPWPR